MAISGKLAPDCNYDRYSNFETIFEMPCLFTFKKLPKITHSAQKRVFKLLFFKATKKRFGTDFFWSLYALLLSAYPRNSASRALASSFLTFTFGKVYQHFDPNTRLWPTFGALPSQAHLSLQGLELLPPITTAEKYFCIGVNYANRNAEYKDGSEAPKNPSVFMRSRESFVGHGQFIERPPESHQLDYEGEIVVIIGKEGRRIKREDARSHIAGLCVMNEGTLRDWVRHAKFNVTQGKNFEKSGALGPWMVPLSDEIDLTDLQIQTRINGELRQDDHTSNMMFPIEFQIEYLSKFARLKPGDIIATGTPNGAVGQIQPAWKWDIRKNSPLYFLHGQKLWVPTPNMVTHNVQTGTGTGKFTRVAYHLAGIRENGLLAVTNPRFAAANPRFWSPWSQGACWALPATTYIPGVNLNQG